MREIEMDGACLGYAQADITPEAPVQMVGYDVRPDNMSRGVLHRLSAQVLVWKSPEETCCLIAVDSLGFTVELTDALRRQAAQALSAAPEKVMVCFSHTHAGPNAAAEPAYYASACGRIVRAVKSAEACAEPVEAAWGTAENLIGENRRRNGGLIDARMGVLKVTSRDTGALKVLLLRVTAHANVLMPDNYLISSDYFGAARDLLERKYGCKAVLLQGAAGDVRPKYRQENALFLELQLPEALRQTVSEAQQKVYFEQSLRSLEKTAELIYQAADRVLDSLVPRPIRRLSMFSAHTVFYAGVPSWERALEIAAEAETRAGIDGTGWLEEVRRLHEAHIERQTADVEIQYLVIGGGCICGTPCEAMSGIAAAAAELSGEPLLFFGGYTNGIGSYLPTAPEYDRGGYEVLWSSLLYYPYYGRVMPYDRDTAERLTAEVVRGWKAFLEGYGGRN